MINNLRDIPTDALVGKRTVAVRIGDRQARWTYAALVALPLLLGAACAVVAPWTLLVLLLSAPVVLLSIAVVAGAHGGLLIKILGFTGMLELAYGVLLGLGLAL